MKKELKQFKKTMWKLKNKPARVKPKPSKTHASKKSYKRIKKVELEF